MIIKKYVVNNMNEAMTRIRYELGKDAVIVSQRKIKKGGFLGIFSKKMLEVTAAVDNSKDDTSEDMQESIEAIKRLMTNKLDGELKVNNNFNEIESKYKSRLQIGEKKEEQVKEYKPVEDGNSEAVMKEMQEMRTMLGEMINMSAAGSLSKSKMELTLEGCDLDHKVIKKIMTKMRSIEDDRTEEEKVKDIIENMIEISPNKLDNVVVLVGPTGVGKTTTIAKLAGRFALIEKKKVGLITIDTYRIGAVEQLRTYADIMNIPFRVVFTMKDMETAVEAMDDCDVILIDTTGRSSKNTMQISELRAFIDKVNTNNINLVISSTTKNKDIEVIVNGYKALNYNGVIITKLDETSTYGSILNILECAEKPISFVTTGQNVPDDIKIMSSKEITKLILGEDVIC
ncbi:flagellar biosynthesis protein FlhF [Clostridium sp. A1-XYC3]|uniref:Flagellar biosynthesis protein FlhF n=1 Tax=Clostridium tanneri TaxID=3037988 RepID=A0ABU4JND9_9CLOT|nr:flagellar biosynthesis protein FlhF [Clostridium sp. A1-XYC3]MDW8799647.1 flagellar biosynthesis protein FlhF [Clostridium sp. A1-XYC3]